MFFIVTNIRLEIQELTRLEGEGNTREHSNTAQTPRC